MHELAPGILRWTAVHPDWQPGEGWEPEVACFSIETARATLLVDPLVPPGDERDPFLRGLDGVVQRRGLPVEIALTGAWHGRSAEELAGRYGAVLHVGPDAPAGVQAVEVDSNPVLWIAERGALAVGDALISVNGELRVWGARDNPDALRPLLELPVEHVLVAHGDHVAGGRDALAGALERPPHY